MRPLLAAQQNGGLTVGHTSLTLHSQPEGLPARDNSVRPAIAASRKIGHFPVRAIDPGNKRHGRSASLAGDS